MKLATLALALAAGGLVAAAPLPARAQAAPKASGAVVVAPGSAAAIASVKANATVVGIDATTRVVTLKTERGRTLDIVAGPEVKNFDKLKVGDKIQAEYTEALTLDLKKGGGGALETNEKTAVVRSIPGEKPGAAAGRQVTVLADVTAVDGKKQMVTLRGPKGNLVDLHVSDPEQLKNIKKGDQVQAVYTEAIALTLESK